VGKKGERWGKGPLSIKTCAQVFLRKGPFLLFMGSTRVPGFFQVISPPRGDLKKRAAAVKEGFWVQHKESSQDEKKGRVNSPFTRVEKLWVRKYFTPHGVFLREGPIFRR